MHLAPRTSHLGLALALSFGWLVDTARAQMTITGDFPDITAEGIPRIAGASNCTGIAKWDVGLLGGNPALGGEYEVFAENPAVGIPPSLIATPAVNPSNGVTFVALDVSAFLGSPATPSNVALVARIKTPNPAGGFYFSDYSARHFLRDASMLQAPVVQPTPLWECGTATGVAGHQPRDSILLRSTTRDPIFVVPSAFGQFDFVGSFAGFSLGEQVFARYTTCSGVNTSPPSALVSVQSYPSGALPKPVIPPAGAVEGVSLVSASLIENGAQLRYTFTRGSQSYNGSRSCVGGEPCGIPVPGPLGVVKQGDVLEVTQELCRGSGSAVESVSIATCDGASPTFNPPSVGDAVLTITSRAHRSTVIAYLCPAGKFSGGTCTVPWTIHGSSFDLDFVVLIAPLNSGETIAVAQRVDASCPPTLATAQSVE